MVKSLSVLVDFLVYILVFEIGRFRAIVFGKVKISASMIPLSVRALAHFICCSLL